LRIAQTRRE